MLASLDDFATAVAVQRAVWGFSDVDVVPLHVLLTAGKNGGVVLGAFEDDEMLGMLFGFPGLMLDGTLKHCSHIAGVVEAARGRGIGSALKWAQRDVVLEQRIELVTWTFDPLEARNAALNLRHLGAIASEYLEDVYGDLADELNQGLPSDRLMVQWWLSSPRVRSRATARALRMAMAESPPTGDGPEMTVTSRTPEGLRMPTTWHAPTEDVVRLEIPASFQRLKARDPHLARDWRFFVREALQATFAHGYVAVDVVAEARDDERAFYVLRRVP